MAQEYTMTEAGLSPATSPEYRAAFKRAKKLFDASQRRPSFNQGAARIISEDIEPGLPKRPIPCIYPEKMPRPYGPATGFNIVPDYDNLGDIAWLKPTRDVLVIRYRGADGGEGMVRMPMPFEHEDIAGFNERKSDYLKKLTGGSDVVDTRTVIDALREENEKASKASKTSRSVKTSDESARRLAYLEELCAAQRKDLENAAEASEIRRERWQQAERHCVYLESVVSDLRAEVIRLTNELNDAREAADTDAADAARARETADELRAELNTLRHLRPKAADPEPILLTRPMARA